MLQSKPFFLAFLALLAIALASSLALRPASADDAKPESKGKVLFILASQHFYYQEYADPKDELTKAGYKVEVTAFATQCTPHENSGQSGDGRTKVDVQPDKVDPSQYKAVVFVGGWGASQYQFAYKGSYKDNRYNLAPEKRKRINDIVATFAADNKTVGAICHGTSALAWSRDKNGESLVKGKKIAVPKIGGPACSGPDTDTTSNHFVKQNGGTPLSSGDQGQPASDRDTVIVDGNIITAENMNTARAFGKTLVKTLDAAPSEKPAAK